MLNKDEGYAVRWQVLRVEKLVTMLGATSAGEAALPSHRKLERPRMSPGSPSGM